MWDLVGRRIRLGWLYSGREKSCKKKSTLVLNHNSKKKDGQILFNNG